MLEKYDTFKDAKAAHEAKPDRDNWYITPQTMNWLPEKRVRFLLIQIRRADSPALYVETEV